MPQIAMMFLKTQCARARLLLAAAVLLSLCGGGCSAAPRNYTAIHSYYQHDYATARDALRDDAMMRNDEQVLLNTARLGMAALADGDLVEAEMALGRTFDLLSTAGLNADRTTAAIMSHEGVRIWKGEPFEQAMMYHYVATLYAVMGDWENVRAAAANSLFRLTDFGGSQTPESLTRHATLDDDYLERGYTAVDTNFALGFLMQAIGAQLSGAGGSDQLFDAAVDIDPALTPLVQQLRQGRYNTLLIVHFGKGPTKISYGPNQALARFVQQEPASVAHGLLEVTVDGLQAGRTRPVTNVSAMARDHRWNNLEDIRRAKGAIGDVLVAGGAMATAIGAQERSAEAALAGAGAMLFGLLLKSSAQADTRYLEFLPQSVYLVPLELAEAGDVQLRVAGGSWMRLENVQPGTYQQPRTEYVRMHGADSPEH